MDVVCTVDVAFAAAISISSIIGRVVYMPHNTFQYQRQIVVYYEQTNKHANEMNVLATYTKVYIRSAMLNKKSERY